MTATAIDLGFLSARYGDLRDGETIELRAIERETHQVVRQWYYDIEELARCAERLTDRYDLYVGVNPRQGHGSSKDGVSRITCLHADVDAKHFPSKADALAALEHLVLRPTIIVDSGGGYQAYWHIWPLPAMAESVALVEDLMKRLYRLINPSLDGVQDVSRIFRLPGSINHKPGRNKALVEVVSCETGREYTLADLANALPPLPERPKPARSQTAPESDVSVEQVRELLRYVDPLLPYEHWLEVLMAVHSVFPDETGYDLCYEWSNDAREAAGCNGTFDKQPEKWWGFKREGVTIGTLYHYAQEGGYEQPKAFTLVERPRRALAVPSWEQPLAQIPALSRAEYPALLGDVVRYLAPVTVAWREDWAEMLALAGLSALLGHLNFGGIRPNLWLLGVSGQSAGKSAASDVLVEVVKHAAVKLNLPLGLMTEATPNGIQAELMEAQGATMLYYSEYSGMLQSLKHEYMAGTKQLLCDLYDGRSFRRRLARETIEAENPYLTLVASTTLSEFVKHAHPEDFVNGYHSRFMFLAPDYLNVTIEQRPSGLECRELAGIVAGHLAALRHVTEVAWHTPHNQKPPAFSDLEAELGVNTGEVIRLEDTLARDDVPPGRVLVRVKKVATLLAACRAVPAVRDGRLLVSDEDVRLARRIVLRGSAYARRLAASLGGSEDATLADAVLRKLAEKGPQLTFRELQRLVKQNKQALDPVLDILLDDGAITRTQAGRSVIYALAEVE